MRMPLSGELYRDDNGDIHTIVKITTMFEKPCIMYEAPNSNNFATFNHYIDIKALHLHSSNEFWFKEPLTDIL